MELPKKKDIKSIFDCHPANSGWNDCHDQFSKAIVERLEEIQHGQPELNKEYYQTLLDGIYKLIQELKGEE